MKVRMKTRAAGPDLGRVLQPGEVVEVDGETAAAWLNGGYAEAVVAEVERAVASPAERTVSPAVSAPALSVSAERLAARIEGMTARQIKVLAAAGIVTIEDLAKVTPAALMAAGVKAKDAARMVDEARLLCAEEGTDEQQ